MAIRTSKIASVTDTGDTSKIQPSDVNPESIPASPANGDIRTERTGTSPNRFVRLYVYDNAAWRLLSEMQY